MTTRKAKSRNCEICHVELRGSARITVGHISSTKTLDLCKDHYQQPEVWQPLYDVVFGEYVKQTKAENPTKTKRKAKKKLMKNRVINL